MNARLEKNETQLVGESVLINGMVESDAVSDRIDYLTEKVLVKLGASEDGWDILYQDKSDERYWELTLPQSAIHGGRPPTLTCISLEIAKTKYGL